MMVFDVGDDFSDSSFSRGEDDKGKMGMTLIKSLKYLINDGF